MELGLYEKLWGWLQKVWEELKQEALSNVKCEREHAFLVFVVVERVLVIVHVPVKLVLSVSILEQMLPFLVSLVAWLLL